VPTSEKTRARAGDRAGTSVFQPSVGDAIVGFSRLSELALGEAGLSVTQYRILQHLRRGRAIQSDLAFRLTVTKQSVTRIVDTLVDRRYVTRRVDSDDRRRVIHAISAKGERALARADAILERYLMLVLQDLDDDADIDAARRGIELFGLAGETSYDRVHPDGIVPGPRSTNLRGAVT
jgi:DNA-binding MarR family transcriptional regulator